MQNLSVDELTEVIDGVRAPAIELEAEVDRKRKRHEEEIAALKKRLRADPGSTFLWALYKRMATVIQDRDKWVGTRFLIPRLMHYWEHDDSDPPLAGLLAKELLKVNRPAADAALEHRVMMELARYFDVGQMTTEVYVSGRMDGYKGRETYLADVGDVTYPADCIAPDGQSAVDTTMLDPSIRPLT